MKNIKHGDDLLEQLLENLKDIKEGTMAQQTAREFSRHTSQTLALLKIKMLYAREIHQIPNIEFLNERKEVKK